MSRRVRFVFRMSSAGIAKGREQGGAVVGGRRAAEELRAKSAERVIV